ncbi:MAG: hypothetical protein WCV92_03200, partial [Candidatus Buchananbacteria bacterium]
MTKGKVLGVCLILFFALFAINSVFAEGISFSAIADLLSQNQIQTNLATFEDPVNATGLYFVESGVGRIEYPGIINLNSETNSSTIASLATNLAFNRGSIVFGADQSSDFKNVPVNVTLNNLKGSSYVVDDLIFKDGSNQIIPAGSDGYPVISNFNYEAVGHTITFSADKFYSVSVIDREAPIVTFLSPTPQSGVLTNQDPAIIKLGSDENLSKAVIQVSGYDNGDFENGNLNSWQTGSSSSWTIDRASEHSGSSAARSAFASGSWISKNVDLQNASDIYFYWKVYSDSDANSFSFYVDNTLVDTISGTQNWQLKKYSASVGTHELKWVFNRGFIANGPTDGGWIDDFFIFNSASSTDMSIVNANGSTVAQYSLSGLTQGKNYYQILVADEAGNEAVVSPHQNVYFDNVAPTCTLTSLPANETYGTNLSISVSGAGVTAYKYMLDNNDYTSQTAVSIKILQSGLGVGPHSIQVVGMDAAGNWQSDPTIYSWTILASQTPVQSTPLPPTNAGGIRISNPFKPTTGQGKPLIVAKPIINSQALQPKVLGVKAFPNGSLLRSIETGRIYLLAGDQKIYISSLQELKKYRTKRMYQVSEDQMSQYIDFRANGTLLRTSDQKIYIINNGKKKHITSLAELKENYKGRVII